MDPKLVGRERGKLETSNGGQESAWQFGGERIWRIEGGIAWWIPHEREIGKMHLRVHL